MPRRTATLLTSTLLLIALLCAAMLIREPYAKMSPGPTYNTLTKGHGETVLQVPKGMAHKTTGHLNMTTVRVTNSEYRMSIIGAVGGWLNSDTIVVPYSTVYPDNKSAQQVNEENAEEFNTSQESAKVVALRELGHDVPARTIVSSVVKDSPAHGTLHAGDVIRAVDGTAVRKPQQVAKLVSDRKPGESVTFSLIPAKEAKRAEKAGEEPDPADEREVTVRTKEEPEDGRAIVGIQPGTAHTFPFKINITLHDVGGPSAGLMFALGLVDKLSEHDLTGGHFIAGTGTIDDDGKVGEIGGIQMKTIAARDEGAEFFLTPKGNCHTAAKTKPDGLTLVETGTMDQAMESLKKIRAGETADLPVCSEH
ncbi:YlbL family protein [Streptomyces sulphureus]|uniref:YlbL family protein n=1 Tax=Streptomyces sulphureus TaxID=47758 RepID=UPI00037CAEBC|nr:PDZ domain-containing protein [Streptomyces sulphureus]